MNLYRGLEKRIKNYVLPQHQADKILEVDRRLLEVRDLTNKPDSALFYTTHKCASVFIPKYCKIVERCSDYQHVDYAQEIWKLGDQLDIGQENENFLVNFLERNADRLFFERGEIYAPLRFPVDFLNRKNLKHVFFLRDPRDVLVSAYYSFGFSHPLAKNKKSRERQLSNREKIQKVGIDQFTLEFASNIDDRYKRYKYFKENSKSFVYLKYEELKHDPYIFFRRLNQFLEVEIPNHEMELLCEKANPKHEGNNAGHLRSGKSNQFLNELNPTTRKELGHLFADTLDYWEFKT